MSKIKGTTPSGFEFEVDLATLEDIEFADALSMMMDESDTQAQMVGNLKYKNLLLGKAQLRKLYAHIRKNNNGLCTVEMVNGELSDIMDGCKDLKNS